MYVIANLAANSNIDTVNMVRLDTRIARSSEESHWFNAMSIDGFCLANAGFVKNLNAVLVIQHPSMRSETVGFG